MKSIKEIKAKKGTKILLRVDFNVPVKEGKIKDDTRIVRTLPTINYLLNKGYSLIIISHLGRPKGQTVLELSLKPVAKRLSELLGKEVIFYEKTEGKDVEEKIGSLKEKEVLLLENIRFHPGETKNSPELSDNLKKLASIYVNEAFSVSHRKHASVHFLPSLFKEKYAGFLMFEEVNALRKVRASPQRPAIAILGGAKIEDKIALIKGLLEIMDFILIGGGMAFTFWKALGKKIGNSLLDERYLGEINTLLETNKVIVPADCVFADSFSAEKGEQGEEIPENYVGLDVGEKTIQIFKQKLKSAKTIFWNGPLGVFEKEGFRKGTIEIAKFIAEMTNKGVYSVAGGGETISAIRMANCEKNISYISTGGGASLEFMEKGTLPGIEVLET